jgi:catechol 2,3-dioxygenase-like lactoylglutathione lyase family enzyme
MIQINGLAFVAYPVAEKQRARDFYEGLLGLKPTMNSDFPEGFWVEYDTAAGTLALSNFWRASGNPEQSGPSVGLEVENFEQSVSDLKTKGVPFYMEPLETPVCHMAVVADPDGNSLFIHKRKPGHS